MKPCISLELHPFPKVFGPFLLPDSKEKEQGLSLRLQVLPEFFM